MRGKLRKKYVLDECDGIQNSLIFFSHIAGFEKMREEYVSY